MQDGSEYEDWALKKECNIVETLKEFTSVRVTADLLLTQLPAMQPVRHWSQNSVICDISNKNNEWHILSKVDRLPLPQTI